MCCFYCHSCVCRNLRKHICKSKVFTRSQYTNTEFSNICMTLRAYTVTNFDIGF